MTVILSLSKEKRAVLNKVQPFFTVVSHLSIVRLSPLSSFLSPLSSFLFPLSPLLSPLSYPCLNPSIPSTSTGSKGNFLRSIRKLLSCAISLNI